MDGINERMKKPVEKALQSQSNLNKGQDDQTNGDPNQKRQCNNRDQGYRRHGPTIQVTDLAKEKVTIQTTKKISLIFNAINAKNTSPSGPIIEVIRPMLQNIMAKII